MSVQRILFVRNSRGITDISGAETYLIDLLRGLMKNGCTVHLVCALDSRRGRPSWLERLDASEIPYSTADVTSIASLADLKATLVVAREFNPEIVHGMDHRSNVIATMLQRRMGVPAVASFFGWTNFSETSLRGRIYPVIDRLIMKRLRRLIVDSEFVGTSTRLGNEKIAVIPNGVDLTRFDPDNVMGGFKRKWFGRENLTVVGLVGRVHPNKGHLDLARAAGELCSLHPDLRFVTLGGTPPGYEGYAESIAHYLARSGLEDKFIMTNVDSRDIPSALASMDIVTLPSYMESLSYVMLEAMAMGRPVISARVGGHGELIKDGVSGFLVDSGDVTALADRIARLSTDEGLRSEISRNARAQIVDQYSIAAMVARTRRVYDEARNE